MPWCTTVLHVRIWERQNGSQRLPRGLLNVLQTTQCYCPFVAAVNAVKVRVVILDAYNIVGTYAHALT